MIAISTTTPTASIEQLQEQLKRQLAALDLIGEAERSAFAAVSAALTCYKEASLTLDYFESFAAKLLALFPPEIHGEYEELDSELVTAQRDRITELETDIDGLLAANKNAQYEISCLKDDLAARAHAEKSKLEIEEDQATVTQLQEKLCATEKRLHEYHAMADVAILKESNAEARLSDVITVCKSQEDRIEELEAILLSRQGMLKEEIVAEAGLEKAADSECKFKVGDRVQVSPDSLTVSAGITGVIIGWFDDAHPEQNSMAKIRWDKPFVHNGVTSPDEGYFSLSELCLVADETPPEEPPVKQESTERKFISPEIAYLKLTINDQVLSGYIGFKNGVDASGKKLSSAKIRASKWMDYIQGLYGISVKALELRGAERMQGFDYEIKISQAKHYGSILSILNSLSRCNFSINPHKDEPPQKFPVDSSEFTPSIEFLAVEPFDKEAPQYKVLHSGNAIGSVFTSYGKGCWKISGDSANDFDTKELAAEELVKRSILPEVSDAAF